VRSSTLSVARSSRNRVEGAGGRWRSERASHKEAFLGLERKYLLERSVLVKSHEGAFAEMKRQARAEAIRGAGPPTPSESW